MLRSLPSSQSGHASGLESGNRKSELAAFLRGHRDRGKEVRALEEERHSLGVTVHSHPTGHASSIPAPAPPQSSNLQLALPLPPASYPGLSQPPPLSSFLPAFFSFLSPQLNRLRQQDGTNLWLNSPKITRDLSKAVCVKLTGACTLLSNELHSKAGPKTVLAQPLCSVMPPELHHTWPDPTQGAQRGKPQCLAPPHLSFASLLPQGLVQGGLCACSPLSPPILFSIWQLHVPAGSPTAGTHVQLAQ